MAICVVLLSVILLLFTEYAVAHLIKKLYVINLRRIAKGCLVLTFDDGPSEKLQQRVLDLLTEYGVKATFFLNAEKAAKYPDCLKILTDSGNEVALHCYKHLHAWRVPPSACISDIVKADKLLKNHLTNHNLLRFPYGKMTLSSYLFFRMKGKNIAFWTHDSGDTHKELPPIASVTNSLDKNNGGVVLMHSFDRGADTYRDEYVVALTRELIEQAKKKNWKICTFSELYHNGS
jgi:peptidoglycan/xylan/chitin deacetylase (PgdA/CDA1 family)